MNSWSICRLCYRKQYARHIFCSKLSVNSNVVSSAMSFQFMPSVCLLWESKSMWMMPLSVYVQHVKGSPIPNCPNAWEHSGGQAEKGLWRMGMFAPFPCDKSTGWAMGLLAPALDFAPALAQKQGPPSKEVLLGGRNQWWESLLVQSPLYPSPCPSISPWKATSPASVEFTACLWSVLLLGHAWAALPWQWLSSRGKGLPLPLEALYGTMHSSCPGTTSVRPTVTGFGLGP